MPKRGSRAVVVVRNPFEYDARVLRAARTAEQAGYRPLVVAARTAPGQPATGHVGTIPVVRVAAGALVRRIDARMRPNAATPAAEAGADRRRGSAAQLALRAFRLLRTVDYYRGAMPVVLRERPALVHCNDFNTMWIGVAAKLLVGSRVVYDSHELWPDRNGRWEWRPWLLCAEALFTRVADAVVTASPGYSERMARRYRIAVPPVIRNVPDAAPAAGGNGVEPEPVAVYVGHLLTGRGLEQAIDALPHVPEVRLRFIGPGSDAMLAALRERARALGVGDRLEIAAPVPPDDVIRALEGAAVGLNLWQPVCLSYELTLPNKLLEYVVAGLPVLSSDVPVCAAFVRSTGVGIVVAADDPVAIARGLAELLEPERNAAVRLRVAAVAPEVTWERERDRLAAVYAAVGA